MRKFDVVLAVEKENSKGLEAMFIARNVSFRKALRAGCEAEWRAVIEMGAKETGFKKVNKTLAVGGKFQDGRLCCILIIPR